MHDIYDPYSALKLPSNLHLDPKTYEMIAYLANPSVPVDKYSLLAEDFRWDPATILWTLAENRILYRFLSFRNSSDRQRRNLVQEVIRSLEQLQQVIDFYEIYEKKTLGLVDDLNYRGFNTVFFKASESLPLDDHNLDLLVKEEERDACEAFLRKAGFIKVNFYREPNKTLYRHVKNAEDYLAIHLHTKISWHGVELVDTRKIWERKNVRRINASDVSFPKPTDHINITIAHRFFESAEITLSDLLAIADDLIKGKADIRVSMEMAKAAGWEDVFIAFLSMLIKLYQKNFKDNLPIREKVLIKDPSFKNTRLVSLLNDSLDDDGIFLPLGLNQAVVQ